MHSKATIRQLAYNLAENGHSAWTFDFPGYGNSSGMLPLENAIEDNAVVIKDLNRHIKEQTGSTPILICLRSASLLLSRDLLEDHESGIVFWHAYSQGAAFVRDLELIDHSLGLSSSDPKLIVAGGYPFKVSEIEKLKLAKLASLECPSVQKALYIHAPTVRRFSFLDSMQKGGTNIEKLESSDLSLMMRSPEVSKIAWNDVRGITNWVSTFTDHDALGQFHTSNQFFNDSSISERVLATPDNLFGILTEPTRTEAEVCLLIPNTGSGHHAGPNGLHTSLARSVARRGVSAYRFDLSNLGNSGIPATNNNHAYTKNATRDITAVIQHLKTKGYSRFILFGLCSGAFSSFDYARQSKGTDLAALFLVNSNTLYWEEGDDPIIPNSAAEAISEAYYKDQARDLSAWLKVARTPTKWLPLTRRILHVIKSKAHARIATTQNRTSKLEKDFTHIVNQNTKIFFYFSPNEPGYTNLKNNTGKTFRTLISDRKVELKVCEAGDHTFTTIESRSSLISEATEYCLQYK
ncbi:hypothetical protein [Reinekea sp. G2M2-21]|uniref:hypothetical protein n=1 Tax=Reinekea sp. G2M2-21 TaxID=2788942 RepID=UPI0018AC4047|nr:hypothetical protein [Reinekea sp. G2M2-21]